MLYEFVLMACLFCSRYSLCDLRVYKNASYYKHNFGTCNMTDFESKEYIPDVLRACNANAKTCSTGCKFYVDKMDSHRCMKGFEKKFYFKFVNQNATRDVWRARDLCAQTAKNPGSHGVSLSAIPACIFALLFLAYKCAVA